MVTNTNRSFGQLNLLNEKVLSNLSKVAAIMNGSGRLLWGALFDKFGFKKLYILIVAVEIGISSTIFQFGNNTIMYFIMVCVTALLLAGNIALMIPLYPKIFGIKYGTEVNGICIALYSFTCILGPVVAKFVVHEKKDYQRLYLSGTVLAVISFIVVCMFKEEPFVFKSDKKAIPHNISKELRNDVFIGDDNEATEMEQV
jgi:MFS family permease